MNKLDNLTIEEKVALCSGSDFWHSKEYPKHDIKSFMMSDGPNGLRKQETKGDQLGVNKSSKATALPTSSISACSFDEDVLEKVGKTIAEEALAQGVKVVLGPGANIKRNPLCGRNFEYYSEDPILSGKMAAAFIRGVESTGAHACLKHFALNNQEYKRFSSNSIVDEKTMREIYLKAFEIAIKQGKPACVMTSYNLINGVHSSENKWLLNILRKEWGFDGLVMTDWGGMSNRSKSFEAGCDLCMPGGSNFGESQAIKDIKEGKLDIKYVNKSCERVLKIAEEKNVSLENKLDEHYNTARTIAENSIVLLKNDDNILPVKEDEICFIGSMAKNIRYQGSGSSHINPYKLVNPLDILNVPFASGVDEKGNTNNELLDEAINLAKTSKKVVIFAGLTDLYESEGYDRENMKMPDGHIKLIEEIAKVNPNVIVVLLSGSSVELPFLDKIKGLIYAGLPGEAGSEAIINILEGKVNPSGKLAESWIKKYEDCICSSYWRNKEAIYKEGIYVGYRYLDKANIEVNFPFGYGLSYTSFAYSDIELKDNILTCKVKNIGNVKGKEIIQLYIKNPSGYRELRTLKDFKKIELEPNEEKVVSFEINDEMFKVYNNGWKVVQGKYEIEIASNSRDIKLSKDIDIDGEIDEYNGLTNWYYEPKGIVSDEDFKTLYKKDYEISKLIKGQFTMDNTVMEMKDYSLMMKIMFKAVEAMIAKNNGNKVDYNDPTFRMMISSSADCSLNGMKICGQMNNCVLEGMLEMANGHFFKGLLTMAKRN